MELCVIDHDRENRIQAEAGDTLLHVLRQQGLYVTAPCGGKGTCRKCAVTIDGIGAVLSCKTRLTAGLWLQAGLDETAPLVVRMPERVRPQVSTSGMLPDLILSPLVAMRQLELPQPSLSDQRADDERLTETSQLEVPYRLLRQLPGQLRGQRYHLTCFYRTDTRALLRLVRRDSPGPLGMAVDIGTTTLAAYLADLSSGRLLATTAMLNPQRAFGADVISRIEQAAAGHQDSLHQVLVRAIAELAGHLLDLAGRQENRDYQLEDIAHLVLAGNTVMMHLLGNIPADAIARTPFIPASIAAQTLAASDLGLPLLPDTICQLLPSMAGYVGADITAGLLATSLHLEARAGKNAILLDIGTNGEIVLATPQGLIACSTAAGPAFEAANISCGLGGIHGAIDRVSAAGGDLTFSVIGQQGQDAPLPAGICGSGLVSAIATFLRLGLIDETGRITDEPENLPPALASRIGDVDGLTRIVLAPAVQSARGSAISLTQKDIRELQNAKAAIAAGVLLLLEKASLTPQQIDTVYIAGGFGNYLDIDDALTIGLLPAPLRGKTRSAGNTAGMGALACLVEQELFQQARELASTITYYELSAQKRFTDLYIEAMLFPEADGG
ncbi:MAG: DUF4445 domain-containing protein [Clostridiaceae bacterium]|nr:DUF4445 domain-containing protein [Clostridiaceae bacterium]